MEENNSQIQTREIPKVENENSHFNSCSKCIHVKTCGAFTAFSEVLNEMEQKYEYVKKPFPAESLAVTCTEYKPIILENGKEAKVQDLGV